MNCLKDITWSEVYQNWRERETARGDWTAHFKSRGFATWEDWRRTYIEAAGLEGMVWRLYEITPQELSGFLCGAFHGWLTRAQTAGSRRLPDLATLPEWDTHGKIQDLFAHFPANTEFIGFMREGQGYLFEGHHRAIALCKLLERGDDISNLRLTIALAELPSGTQHPLVDFCPKECMPAAAS